MKIQEEKRIIIYPFKGIEHRGEGGTQALNTDIIHQIYKEMLAKIKK